MCQNVQRLPTPIAIRPLSRFRMKTLGCCLSTMGGLASPFQTARIVELIARPNSCRVRASLVRQDRRHAGEGLLAAVLRLQRHLLVSLAARDRTEERRRLRPAERRRPGAQGYALRRDDEPAELELRLAEQLGGRASRSRSGWRVDVVAARPRAKPVLAGRRELRPRHLKRKRALGEESVSGRVAAGRECRVDEDAVIRQRGERRARRLRPANRPDAAGRSPRSPPHARSRSPCPTALTFQPCAGRNPVPVKVVPA